MSDYFDIASDHKGQTLHLKLAGHFDGASAYELINFLKLHRKKYKQILIHADNLNIVYPFGLLLFQEHFSMLNGKVPPVVAMGKHKEINHADRNKPHG